MLIATLAATLTLGAFDSASNRCKIGALRDNPEGYVWPLPNIRAFVDEAELIVRAKAIGLGPAQALPIVYSTMGTSVQFEIVEVLKGDRARTQLFIPGDSTSLDDFNPEAVPYQIVRNGGQRGNCIATSYKLGAEYLLLLRIKNEILNPYWAPLAPLNEQITGSDDAWVTWVRRTINDADQSNFSESPPLRELGDAIKPSGPDVNCAMEQG